MYNKRLEKGFLSALQIRWKFTINLINKLFIFALSEIIKYFQMFPHLRALTLSHLQRLRWRFGVKPFTLPQSQNQWDSDIILMGVDYHSRAKGRKCRLYLAWKMIKMKVKSPSVQQLLFYLNQNDFVNGLAQRRRASNLDPKTPSESLILYSTYVAIKIRTPNSYVY